MIQNGTLIFEKFIGINDVPGPKNIIFKNVNEGIICRINNISSLNTNNINSVSSNNKKPLKNNVVKTNNKNKPKININIIKKINMTFK